jgi:hypothetical protein
VPTGQKSALEIILFCESVQHPSLMAMLTGTSCDAGGGTVDLISYKITQTTPTFRVEEAAVGSGDKCGATYVDKVNMSIDLFLPPIH